MKNKSSKSADQISHTQKQLDFKNQENEKLTTQLALVNKELVFKNEEKEKLTSALDLANIEITFHNGEKQKQEAELMSANLELVFKNEQNEKCAASLTIVNKELVKTVEQLSQFHTELKQQVDERSTELIKAEKRFRAMIENSADMKTLATIDGKLLYASPSVTRVVGYSAEEFFNIPGPELIHPDDLGGFIEKIQHMLQSGSKSFFSQHRILHKNGNWLWCEGTVSNMLHEESIQGLVSNFRDITVRKAAEDEMTKANRMYAFISGINQSIVHITDEQELLNIACTVATEIGKFKMAWIGLLDNNKLNRVSFSGDAEGAKNILKTSFDFNDPALKNTPTAKVMQTGIFVFNNDVQNDAALSVWRDEFVLQGIYASISLPIFKFEKVVGILGLHAGVKDFFDEKEIALLEEAADDISFALENFERKALHKKAEEKVKESETKLKKAQAVAHFGHWELDLESGIALWSDEACKIYGIDPLDNMQPHDDWKTYVHTDDMEYVMKKIDEQRATLSPVSFEHRIVRKDGSVRHIHSESAFTFDTNGKPLSLYGINHDITERKTIQEKLEKTYKEVLDYKYALDESSIVAVTDQKGLIKYANDNFCNISQYSREELIGQDHRILNSGYHSKEFIRELWATIESGKSWKGELKNKAKDGSLYWVDTTIVPFLDKQGKPIQYIAIRKNITERKDTEAKLLQLNTRFLLATTSSGMGIWDWDIENNNLTWDEGMHKLYKTDDSQFGSVYDGWLSKLHPEDKSHIHQEIQLALTGEKEYNTEFRIIWRDASVHYIKASGIVERDAEGNAKRMIGANLDITELKEKNEQLRSSEAFNRGVLSSLSSHIAVIDHAGEIVAVNEAWNRFSLQNGETALQRTGKGSNYFSVCEKSLKEGDEIASDALEGLKGVIEGKTNGFYLEYPCHSPTKKRWFGMRAMKFESDRNMIVVAHENITKIKKAEQERDASLLELEERVEARTKDLADKNKDITDSINYAKRIQLGLLPRPSQLTALFPKSFVFSEPQNIVSGDFFWCYQMRNKKFIVVADCTGHGVPGALMSIIGNNLLNQIIIDEHIENPSEILELLDERLTAAVKGDTQEVKDGMDIALCMIDTSFSELYYAGAYQPIYISDTNGKISELTASRFSIGAGTEQANKRFETKRFSITTGQRIYLSSDGYYSQFGGDKDKKFMKSGFRKALEELQTIPLIEQNSMLKKTLSDWAGENEQVDDVLVVGIEL
jgi:PAS domain S-box-containing protein